MMTGEVVFTPGAQVVLGPSNVGGPAATCTITFQVDVLQLPTKDADLQEAGVQTKPLARALVKGVASGFNGTGSASTKVTVGLTTVYTDRTSFLQAAGQTTQINFDQDACGNTVTVPSGGLLAGSTYLPVGVTFAAGVIFKDVSFATSPPNIISNSQINTPTPALVDGTFASAVQAVGIDNVGAGAVLRVFGVNNELIRSAKTDTDTTTSDFIGITSPVPIHRFEYDFVSGLGFGGDNLVFTQIIRTPDCTASSQIKNLIEMVSGLEHGVATSLNAKLQNALQAVDRGNLHRACGSLGAFVNHVEAQSGKHLAMAQADQLLVGAAGIEAALGCR